MTGEIKNAVSVAEMARMVGLSRARFYQLIGSAFPFPVYDVASRRPFYNEDAQRVCLEVRRRNCGIDGKPIMFYARRVPITATPTKRTPKITAPKTNPHIDVVEGLRALGLSVTTAQVEAAIKVVFPSGTHGRDLTEIVRPVFIHLQRQGA